MIGAILKILGFFGIFIAYAVLYAIIFVLCWNYVMPDIFKLPEISFLQSFCLILIARSLFPNKTSKD